MQERGTIDVGPGGSTGMQRASGGVLPPMVIAELVVRNLVPVAGILSRSLAPRSRRRRRSGG